MRRWPTAGCWAPTGRARRRGRSRGPPARRRRGGRARRAAPRADTRARVLDAAWQRVLEHGPGGASVKDIAAAAGVSRQLVYFHYGSRAGLLTAMARHRDEASGFARAVAAGASLEALLRAWCDYVPDMLPVARALEAALITGDEGGSAWPDRMGETATDWIWARVQPSTYAHLVGERGWTHAEYSDRTVASLLRETLNE